MILTKLFTEFYSAKNQALLGRMKTVVDTCAPAIARQFYAAMLDEEQTRQHLTVDLVQSRLTASMTAWVQDLFVLRETQSDIEAYIGRQRRVGHVHARIELPLLFVGYGQHVLKEGILGCLRTAWTPPEDLPECLILAGQIIDASVNAINEAYALDASEHDQTLGSLQLFTAGKFLALDCERSRSSLSEWLASVLMALQRKTLGSSSYLNLHASDFGLWLTHKASLIMPERKEYHALLECTGRINAIVEHLRHTECSESELDAQVDQLQATVHHANWILSLLSQEAVDMDSSKDTLTRLFNRRYLDPIMRHEVKHCQKI